MRPCYKMRWQKRRKPLGISWCRGLKQYIWLTNFWQKLSLSVSIVSKMLSLFKKLRSLMRCEEWNKRAKKCCSANAFHQSCWCKSLIAMTRFKIKSRLATKSYLSRVSRGSICELTRLSNEIWMLPQRKMRYFKIIDLSSLVFLCTSSHRVECVGK